MNYWYLLLNYSQLVGDMDPYFRLKARMDTFDRLVIDGMFNEPMTNKYSAFTDLML